jgi:hypothetical protein
MKGEGRSEGQRHQAVDLVALGDGETGKSLTWAACGQCRPIRPGVLVNPTADLRYLQPAIVDAPAYAAYPDTFVGPPARPQSRSDPEH